MENLRRKEGRHVLGKLQKIEINYPSFSRLDRLVTWFLLKVMVISFNLKNKFGD